MNDPKNAAQEVEAISLDDQNDAEKVVSKEEMSKLKMKIMKELTEEISSVNAELIKENHDKDNEIKILK